MTLTATCMQRDDRARGECGALLRVVQNLNMAHSPGTQGNTVALRPMVSTHLKLHSAKGKRNSTREQCTAASHQRATPTDSRPRPSPAGAPHPPWGRAPPARRQTQWSRRWGSAVRTLSWFERIFPASRSSGVPSSQAQQYKQLRAHAQSIAASERAGRPLSNTLWFIATFISHMQDTILELAHAHNSRACGRELTSAQVTTNARLMMINLSSPRHTEGVRVHHATNHTRLARSPHKRGGQQRRVCAALAMGATAFDH